MTAEGGAPLSRVYWHHVASLALVIALHLVLLAFALLPRRGLEGATTSLERIELRFSAMEVPAPRLQMQDKVPIGGAIGTTTSGRKRLGGANGHTSAPLEAQPEEGTSASPALDLSIRLAEPAGYTGGALAGHNPVRGPAAERFAMRRPVTGKDVIEGAAQLLGLWPPGYTSDPCPQIRRTLAELDQADERNHALIKDKLAERARYCR